MRTRRASVRVAACIVAALGPPPPPPPSPRSPPAAPLSPSTDVEYRQIRKKRKGPYRVGEQENGKRRRARQRIRQVK
eukprot:scaffold98385_cov30-Tisochrysis_lutea.AAC.3